MVRDVRLDPNPADVRRFWSHEPQGFQPGGQAYADLVSALRLLQDTVTCSDPDSARADEARALIDRAQEILEPVRVAPGAHYAGLRADLPGRGHPFLMPFYASELSDDFVRGEVTFSPFFVGGGIATHGGAVAMMFDEILGRLANQGRKPSRTAYLHVDYRRITPIGRRLTITARVTGGEGRKLFLEGELTDDGEVLATSNGLWIVLRDDHVEAA